MAGVEISLPERNNSPCLSLLNSISETEEDEQMFKKHVTLKRKLETNVQKQNEFISSIVKAYYSQENELNKKLLEIAIAAALNLSSDPDLMKEAPQNFMQNLRNLNNNYGYANDEFLTEMNKWLEQRMKVVEHLQSTVHTLRLLQQTTSIMALMSSAMEITRGIGRLLDIFFEIGSKPKYPSLLALIIGSVSFTGSLIALSYSKQTTKDIFRDLREEKYLLRNLLFINRKGNAVDEDVRDLFPHGIDLNLVKRLALDRNENFMDDTSWKQNISVAIMLPNFKQNRRLINDRNFLASVKAFVESPAAKIWLYRIKLRKLLEDAFTSLEHHLDEKTFAGKEVLNLAAMNLYSIIFPVFVDTRNIKKLRFVCSSMAAISAVTNLSKNDGEAFEEIKRTSQSLFKDYKKLKNFSEEFMSEYD